MSVTLYFQSPAKTSAPEKLAGVRDVMSRRGHTVQVIEEPPTPQLINRLWAFWHPLGAIIDCGGEYNDIDAKIFAGRHVVFLGHNPDTLPGRCLLVSNDQAETAKAAARELLSTGYDSFAFVHTPKRNAWSEQRARGFADAIALNGKSCAVFTPPANAGMIRWMSGLRRFLSSLPRPCAVFAANDKTAESVLAAAALEKMHSPGDIAIVGVDNFSPICENSSPALSSVEPDFRRGGNLAARAHLVRRRVDRRGTAPTAVTSAAITTVIAVLARAALVARLLGLLRRLGLLGLSLLLVLLLLPLLLLALLLAVAALAAATTLLALALLLSGGLLAAKRSDNLLQKSKCHCYRLAFSD